MVFYRGEIEKELEGAQFGGAYTRANFPTDWVALRVVAQRAVGVWVEEMEREPNASP